jgi:hypothetical protein
VDYGIPLYFSNENDPVYTINCVSFGGRCQLKGMKVHIPKGAQPEYSGGGAGQSDHHMGVLDQAQGIAFDMWQVNIPSGNGGTLDIGWGGYTAVGGDGIHSEGTHGGFTDTSGLIEPADLMAGIIGHALNMNSPCLNDESVFPAITSPSDETCSNPNAAHYGDWIVLNMTSAEIDAEPWPAYEKVVAHALATYGGYPGGTGDQGAMAAQFEAKETWTSFGYPNLWSAAAKQFGVSPIENGQYLEFSFRDIPVDKFIVLDPCEAAGTCQ